MSKEVRLKGVVLGQGIPAAVVSLTGQTPEDIASEAYAARQKGADIFEWRADHFEAVNPQGFSEVLEMLQGRFPETPVLFTLRSYEQGAWRKYEEQFRLEALQLVIQGKLADAVDVELSLGSDAAAELVDLAHGQGIVPLVSQHDFSRTPPHATMDEMLHDAVQTGADIVKLAVMAKEEGDEIALMASVFAAHENNPDTLFCGISMGELGTITRIAGESFGSCMTFCAGSQSTAPGQVDVTLAKQLMGQLHADAALQDGGLRV